MFLLSDLSVFEVSGVTLGVRASLIISIQTGTWTMEGGG
jgi:hypothetical protein